MILIFQIGCATKYVVPGNRFLTPESQGSAFRGQVELQQTQANQLKIDTSNSTVDEGVIYDEVLRTGFLYSNSLFDQFDVFWSHIASANSMLGGKIQLLGGARSANVAGHKLSIAAAFGGNEHETDDRSVEFNLSGSEYLFLYGYRFSENILAYSSYSLASYQFTGELRSSTPGLNGAEPEFETRINSYSLGLEFAYQVLFFKLESTYQQLATTDTKDKERIIFGFSLGLQW